MLWLKITALGTQHFLLMPCMTEPIVLRKQRSSKPSFWDVNEWEIYDQFVRHVWKERAKLLMQQNVLPRSLSTNNLLYPHDANHATVNNFDESNSDASAETVMWTHELYVDFVWTIQSISCDKQNVTTWDAKRTRITSAFWDITTLPYCRPTPRLSQERQGKETQEKC